MIKIIFKLARQFKVIKNKDKEDCGRSNQRTRMKQGQSILRATAPGNNFDKIFLKRKRTFLSLLSTNPSIYIFGM
jgi:hypothetical protein